MKKIEILLSKYLFDMSNLSKVHNISFLLPNLGELDHFRDLLDRFLVAVMKSRF